MAEQSSRCPQRLFIPARPASITPARLCSVPLATRAAPAGGTRSVGKGGQCSPRCAGGLRRDAAAGGQRCHRSVTSGGAGGAGWPFCHLPSLLRARPRSAAEGWQPPGALPARTGPPVFARSPLAPLPAPGGVWGSGCGASRGGKAG